MGYLELLSRRHLKAWLCDATDLRIFSFMPKHFYQPQEYRSIRAGHRFDASILEFAIGIDA